MPQASSTETETVRGEPAPGVKSQERQPICLQVGQTLFITIHHTLCKESTYFQSQLTSGSYFMDAGPGLFSYILRYLCSTGYLTPFHQDYTSRRITSTFSQMATVGFGRSRRASWSGQRLSLPNHRDHAQRRLYGGCGRQRTHNSRPLCQWI